MSELETSARPYARAIFELAKETSSLVLWADRLQAATQIVSNVEMQAMLSSPAMEQTQKAELLLSVVSGLKEAPEFDTEAQNLIKLLAENERLLSLPTISTMFESFKQEAEGTVEVQVVSARKLTVKQTTTIAAAMKKRLGKEVSVTSEIDKNMLAGAIIRAGDLVIDGTALGRLHKLSSQLNR